MSAQKEALKIWRSPKNLYCKCNAHALDCKNRQLSLIIHHYMKGTTIFLRAHSAKSQEAKFFERNPPKSLSKGLALPPFSKGLGGFMIWERTFLAHYTLSTRYNSKRQS